MISGLRVGRQFKEMQANSADLLHKKRIREGGSKIQNIWSHHLWTVPNYKRENPPIQVFWKQKCSSNSATDKAMQYWRPVGWRYMFKGMWYWHQCTTDCISFNTNKLTTWMHLPGTGLPDCRRPNHDIYVPGNSNSQHVIERTSQLPVVEWRSKK